MMNYKRLFIYSFFLLAVSALTIRPVYAEELFVQGDIIFNSVGQKLGDVKNGKALDINGNPIANATITQVGDNSQTTMLSTDASGNITSTTDTTNNQNNNNNANLNLNGLLNGSGSQNGSSTNGSSGSSSSSTNSSSTGANSPTVNAPKSMLAESGNTQKQAVASPITAAAGEFAPTGIDAGSGNKSSATSKSLGDKVKKTNINGTIENDLMDSFNGWSTLYHGIRNSTLIVDPYQIESEYPELYRDDTASTKRPSLGKAYDLPHGNHLFDAYVDGGKDIGVDDEILKTSMAIYQPIRRMQKDFLEDTAAKDAYLENALTVRGIAVMTMGFLDKTVGAGLTAIQQQADQETVQNLLKQISWTTSKMANPDRSQVYRDTDEKLEACLEVAFKNQAPKDQIDGLSRKIVKFKCDDKCGTAPTASKPYRTASTDYKEQGNGTYAYCVCCAETKSELNSLTAEIVQEDKLGRYSLARRLFYGTKNPTDTDQKIEKTMAWFRKIYGDVLIQKKEESDIDGALTYVYLAPSYSPRRLASAFKDGCKDPQSPSEVKMDATPGTECNDIKEDFGIQYGICPAFVGLLQDWKNASKKSTRKPEHVVMWIEASLGSMLTANDFQNALNWSTERSTLAPGEEPSGELRRWLRNFCNASSFTAVTRFQAKFSQVVNDHLVLNQQLSSIEKGKVLELMSRVSQHIALAEKDSSSSYPVESQLEGLAVKSGRDNAGKSEAIAVAASANQARASENDALSGFGAFASTNLDAASTASTVRKNDPISQVINSIK